MGKGMAGTNNKTKRILMVHKDTFFSVGMRELLRGIYGRATVEHVRGWHLLYLLGKSGIGSYDLLIFQACADDTFTRYIASDFAKAKPSLNIVIVKDSLRSMSKKQTDRIVSIGMNFSVKEVTDIFTQIKEA